LFLAILDAILCINNTAEKVADEIDRAIGEVRMPSEEYRVDKADGSSHGDYQPKPLGVKLNGIFCIKVFR
jgi:hypothetical protein